MAVGAVSITPADLEPFASIPADKAQAMIDDAMAMAKLVAPCMSEITFGYPEAAKAIIRGAILRWHDAGSGALSQYSRGAGTFNESQTFDTRQVRRAMFTPAEIEQLQKFCKQSSEDGGAWSYDTVGSGTVAHADICSLNFGAQYCSCGAVLTGFAPLWD